MLTLAKRLFPICRSITGNGTRETLSIIKEKIPSLNVFEVASGTQAFDWAVPKEWNISDAYIINPEGEKIVDFKNNNLHVVGYSTPIEKTLTLDELQNNLYSLPEHPTAIPYITSYYQERWGFCITENQRKTLKPGNYHVCIKSTLENGNLTYGEVVFPGKSKKEVFLSTNICHPSMANNELSGPVVLTAIAEWLASLPNRNYTYRLIFIPETIGSLVYLSRNLSTLKENVFAGLVLSCIGDERCYSFLPSREGNTLSDRAARHVLFHTDSKYKSYSFLDRGSDERQYCAPGIDLPIASIMRSKYDTFPEYHTSLDDFSLVTALGLEGGFNAVRTFLEVIEANKIYKGTVLGEPQLGKRGLYPSLSTKETISQVASMMNILAYCDGSKDLLEVAEAIGKPLLDLVPIVQSLKENGLLR